MSQATNGDTVKVHYTGTLDDGTRFDSSAGRAPLEFTLGVGGIIPGFEKAVTGMSVGEIKRITIPAEEAYGPHREDLVHVVARNEIPDHIELADGLILEADAPDGNRVRLAVVELDEISVTVDGNHPLAGKALTFDLELVAIT